MYQPLGYQHPGHVCLLKKSFYGLKQAPRARYQRFAYHVSSIDFSHSTLDHSLFTYRRSTSLRYLYVDDIILTTFSHALLQSIIFNLSLEFATKDLGA